MRARDGDQRRGKEKRRGRGREMGKKMGTTVKKSAGEGANEKRKKMKKTKIIK
jgi:hypothetical protein